jgi:hypothetical protein
MILQLHKFRTIIVVGNKKKAFTVDLDKLLNYRFMDITKIAVNNVVVANLILNGLSMLQNG